MPTLSETNLFAGGFVPEEFLACNGAKYYLGASSNHLQQLLGARYRRPLLPGSNTNPSQCNLPELKADTLMMGHGKRDMQFILHEGVGPMEGFAGMIKMYAGEESIYTEGWLICNGQEIAIADYPALFEVIGAKYGGDGTSTFALPKLNGSSLSPIGKAPKYFICTSTPDDYYEYSMISLVTLFAGDTLPEKWMFCDGQTLQLMQNMPLYSIIGTKYGGDGRQTICLPNMSADAINEGTVAPKFIICTEGQFVSEHY
ncbi:MAG: phage tail protein [Chitinophagales bacterium]